MLKNLLQLLLETFIKSKREWISTQAFPSKTEFISVAWNGQDYQDFTAPTNGTLCVTVQGSSWVRIYPKINLARNVLQNNDGEYKAFVNVVSKGETMVINIHALNIKAVQIWFIPSNS